jgi:D-threo-aldose 1-dehydrogenase
MTRAELPAFGLGCAAFGNLFRARTDDEVTAVLEAAWAAGVRYFDTAPHYGLGLSERRLGRFLAGKPREEYVVSTKAGRLLRPQPEGAGRRDDEGFDVPADLRREWDLTPGGVRASLEESLERLGLDRVDILFLHDPESSGLPGAVEQGMASLVALREEGLVAQVGIGSTTPTALEAGARAGADVVMAAGCYTLLDQGVSPGVLDACRDGGARIVAAAVFHSGLLSSSPRAGAMFDYARVPDDVLARAQRIDAVCERHGVEIAAAALRYPLLDPLVDSVVVGVDDPRQLAQNLDRLAADIPAALWTELDAEGLVPRRA